MKDITLGQFFPGDTLIHRLDARVKLVLVILFIVELFLVKTLCGFAFMGVLLALAVATSIDALAVGVTFAFLSVNIVWAVSFIGVTTFTISLIGVKIGNIFGTRYKSKAELAGGIILVLIGCKILLEHLGIL